MKNEESLDRLETILRSDFSWPSVYMFKLILPADHRIFALVRALFPEEARVFVRNSDSGKYIIITVKELMISPEEVIERYRKALEINGVLVL